MAGFRDSAKMTFAATIFSIVCIHINEFYISKTLRSLAIPFRLFKFKFYTLPRSLRRGKFDVTSRPRRLDRETVKQKRSPISRNKQSLPPLPENTQCRVGAIFRLIFAEFIFVRGMVPHCRRSVWIEAPAGKSLVAAGRDGTSPSAFGRPCSVAGSMGRQMKKKISNREEVSELYYRMEIYTRINLRKRKERTAYNDNYQSSAYSRRKFRGARKASYLSTKIISSQ